MAVHNARSLSLWVPTLALVIFVLSFLHLNITPATAPTTPSRPQEQVVRKRPSALDKEPLRIYLPPDSLPTDNPLYEIPGLHHAASSPPATYPDEPHGEPSEPVSTDEEKVSTEEEKDSAEEEKVSTKEEKDCPVQPFDISKCPSVQRIAEHLNPSIQNAPVDPQPPRTQHDRPLILYAYSESEFGRINLAFFVNHGLHDSADFIFILNGETDVDTKVLPVRRPNIRIIKRENTCFDLGAHAEVLTAEQEDGGPPLKDQYKRFILMNASIRGPFVPHWSRECWSDAYLGRLNEKVKLVGSSLNCHGGSSPHVQSMIWATDATGLSIILQPEGIGECFPSLQAAMGGEIRTTPHLRASGYEVDVMLSIFQTEKNYKYIDCQHPDDFLFSGNYFGFNVHPFETLFVKSHRGIDDSMLEKLSAWQDMAGYSSYHVCRKLSGSEESRGGGV